MTALEPENWLTYRGDHRGSVGLVMGPGWGVGVSTVVAANYDPTAGERGITRLGMVSGDVRAELAQSPPTEAEAAAMFRVLHEALSPEPEPPAAGQTP